MSSFRQDKGEDAAGEGVLFLREQQIRLAQEMISLVWRDTERALSALQEELEVGPAQCRAIQMLAMHPHMTVGALQAALGVTKQSLARTLGELLERGFVRSVAGRQDRRQRRLLLTEAGEAIEARLFSVQRERLVAAYREAGGDAVQGFRQVLRGLLSEESRSLVSGDAGRRDVTRRKTRHDR